MTYIKWMACLLGLVSGSSPENCAPEEVIDLLNEYVDAIREGQSKDIQRLMARCPSDKRKEFYAFQGSNFKGR